MTIVETIYKPFSEWEPEVQQRILDKHRDWNVDDNWAEFSIQHWAEKLAEYGINCIPDGSHYRSGKPAIHYSISYSQGDGSMFEGSCEDFQKLFTKLNQEGFTNLSPDIIATLNTEDFQLEWEVEHRGHYQHSYCSQISYDVNCWGFLEENGFKQALLDTVETQLTDQESGIENWYHHICDKMYRDLLETYEALTSDKYLTETFNESDHEFSSSGAIL